MNPGKYIVRVKNVGIKGEGDKLRPFIEFHDGMGNTVQWSGSLSSDKAKEYAMKAAITCGFTGESWADFNLAKVSTSKDIEIEVSEREFKGKMYPEVKYINEPKTMKLASASDVRARLGDSKKEFALYRAKNGVAKPASTPPQHDQSEDIPF